MLAMGRSTAPLSPHASHNHPCILGLYRILDTTTHAPLIFIVSLTKSLQAGDPSKAHAGAGAGAGAGTITPYYAQLKAKLSKAVSGAQGLLMCSSLCLEKLVILCHLLLAEPFVCSTGHTSN